MVNLCFLLLIFIPIPSFQTPSLLFLLLSQPPNLLLLPPPQPPYLLLPPPPPLPPTPIFGHANQPPRPAQKRLERSPQIPPPGPPLRRRLARHQRRTQHLVHADPGLRRDRARGCGRAAMGRSRQSGGGVGDQVAIRGRGGPGWDGCGVGGAVGWWGGEV